MLRYALAALAAAAAAAYGAPQAEAECPQGAFQHIYSVRAEMLAGQVTDANTPYAVAMAGIQQCPDDADVQGLSSTVLAILANALAEAGEDPATLQTVLEKSFEAAVVNERLNAVTDPAPTVKYADGTEKAVYPYGEVNHYLKIIVYPQLLSLHQQGHPQAMFSGQALETCPYPGDQDRARLEAETLAQLPPTYFIKSDLKDATGFAEVEARLLALRAACENVSAKATWELAQMHNDRRAKLQEYIGYGSYPDSRAEIIAEAEAHGRKAEEYYRAFWQMDVSHPGDRHNQETVSDRLAFLSISMNRLEEIK